MSSGIFLKLVDFAKSAPRLHGSMVFEVLALRFLMVFSRFSCYFPYTFSLHFWTGFGRQFVSFLDRLLELLGSKGRQHVNKNHAKIGIENWSFAEGMTTGKDTGVVARRGPPLKAR
jgi:hypothetical protein